MTLHSVNCLSHNELLVLAQHRLLPRQLTTTRKHTTVSRYDTGRLPFAHIEVAQLQPMGWTAEMVAQTYNVSREKQDEYALISHTRATQVPISSYWRKLIFYSRAWVGSHKRYICRRNHSNRDTRICHLYGRHYSSRGDHGIPCCSEARLS